MKGMLLGLLTMIVMSASLIGCRPSAPPPTSKGSRQPAGDEAPSPTPSRKGDVARVKPQGCRDTWETVGIVSPLESSSADVAAMMAQALTSAAQYSGHSSRSALVHVSDERLAEAVAEGLRRRGLAVDVVVTPSEDPNAIYRTAADAITRGCDVAFVVRGQMERPDFRRSEPDDTDPDQLPVPVPASVHLPQRPVAPPLDPRILIPTATKAVQDRMRVAGIDFGQVHLVPIFINTMPYKSCWTGPVSVV